jgi:hypothetical protein
MVQDYAGEAEEARRMVEEVESQAAQQAEADSQEKANLRCVRTWMRQESVMCCQFSVFDET